jgi:hypothetical protein
MTLTEQNFEIFKGDTRDLITSVINTDGSKKDLTDASVVWALYNADTKEILVTKSTITGGVVITNPIGGIIKVSLAAGDTVNLKSGPWYRYETEVTDAGSNVSTVNSGYVTLWESVV